MRPLLAFILAAVLVTGCDFSRPITPTAPAPPVPAPSPAAVYTVSGKVTTADNVPVTGARIVVLDQESATATTDADGRYSVSGVTAGTALQPPLVSASKVGFFTGIEYASGGYALLSRDTQLDFRLVPWELIPLAEVVTGRVEAGGPDCSHWGYGTHPCKKFAVTVPATGGLDVTLTASDNRFDVDVVGPNGTFLLYGSPTPGLPFKIGVEAGATYEIRIIPWSSPRDFQVLAVLR